MLQVTSDLWVNSVISKTYSFFSGTKSVSINHMGEKKSNFENFSKKGKRLVKLDFFVM